MVNLFAIDPGPEESAWLRFDEVFVGPEVCGFGKSPNSVVLDLVRARPNDSILVIEMIASYGMPVGAEVFETCVWIGRFIEGWNGPFKKIYRREVKSFLCGDSKAKDANIRQALIDRFGGKDKAIGNKKSPGPLYGISADVWSALAIAVTWHGINGKRAA